MQLAPAAWSVSDSVFPVARFSCFRLSRPVARPWCPPWCRAMLRSRSRRSALLLLVRAVHAHAEAACAAPPPGVSAYPLLQKWPAGNQSYVLRFALPAEEGALGWRGAKAFLDGEDEKTGGPVTLEKSYSPVSLPSVENSFDLLVKASGQSFWQRQKGQVVGLWRPPMARCSQSAAAHA